MNETGPLPDIAFSGGCLCGGVRYRIDGPMREILVCHCGQCQRTSGNVVAASNCASADLVFVSDETLAWYRSSAEAERGFCKVCGGNLFWRRVDSDTTSVMAGTLDQPTGLKVREHIFVADKGDWYEITDGLPQHATVPPDRAY